MRGFKRIALLGALMMIFSSVAVQANRATTDFSVVKNAVAAEVVLENDKELTVENMSSFNGIRVSVSGQVESDAAVDAYARRTVLYAGLGEDDRDLTEAESLSIRLKFVTTNSARLFVVLADGKGNTAVNKFYATRPNDGQPLGSKFYDESGEEVSLTEASGSAWEGVTVATKGTAGVLVCARSGFYMAEAMWNDNAANAQTNKNEYGIADKTVTPDGEFDWSDVRRVMISFTTWNVNTIDVGDISAKYEGGEEKILFDAAESERKSATEIATLGKDEWVFAPRLNYIESWLSDKGGVFENLGKEGATITAARVKKNGWVFGRKSAATVSDIWTKISTPDGNDYGDITAYDAFTFNLDAESLTQNGKIDFVLRVKSGEDQKDYRAYGNGTVTSNYFHYVDGKGEVTTNSSRGIGGNVIPKGFNGSYIIPMNAFEGTSPTDHPTQDELKNTVALLMVFVGANFNGSETVSVSNVKLIDDFAAQIPLYQVNNALLSMRAKITDENYELQKNLVEKAEDGYKKLSAAQKSRVENYEKLAETKTAVAAYGITLTEREIDGLETTVTDENYKAVKQSYARVYKQYTNLGEGMAAVKNAEKLQLVLDGIETYEAGKVSEKMNALSIPDGGDAIAETKRLIAEAKAAYGDLSEGAKKKVTGLEKLANAENAVNEYEAAPVSAMLAALSEKVTKENYQEVKAAFQEAQNAYADLSVGAQEKVQNVEKFAAVKSAIEAYEKSLENKGCGSAIGTTANTVSATVITAAFAAMIFRAKTRRRDTEEESNND